MNKYESQVIAVTKPGCPACEQTKSSIRRAQNTLKKQVRFQEINADTNDSLVDQYDVQAYPEFVYQNKHGDVHKMPWSGIPSHTALVSWVNSMHGTPTQQQQHTTTAASRCTTCSSENGVDPSVWGPPLWFVIHTLALSYPSKPTPTQRTQMMDFFRQLKDHLPCRYCRQHFAAELKRVPPSVFDSRDSLFEWTVNFHDSVSDRTHNPQPRYSVQYWKQFYKNHVYAVIRNRSK